MSNDSTIDDLFDNEGFVTDAELWNRDLALSIAAEIGVDELSELHWLLIDEIRLNYLEKGALPWMAHLCRERGLEPDCIYVLFGGPLEAWKIAGLPNPGEEAKTYMENEEPPSAPGKEGDDRT
jgi:tRNA 2-thiouridine synthesizing protein E